MRGKLDTPPCPGCQGPSHRFVHTHYSFLHQALTGSQKGGRPQLREETVSAQAVIKVMTLIKVIKANNVCSEGSMLDASNTMTPVFQAEVCRKKVKQVNSKGLSGKDTLCKGPGAGKNRAL